MLETVLLAAAFAAADVPAPDTVAAGAKLVELWSEDRFFEGPVWDPKTGKLYFTAFGKANASQIMRLDAPGKATVWADKTEGVNGTCLSFQGRLVGAQAFGHRLLEYKIGESGPDETEVLLEDKTLNQPNDVKQGPDGSYWFTDPDFKERKKSSVRRLSKSGKVTTVITDMALPNGLVLSLDGRTLYVGDSHHRHWRSYPINKDGTVGEGKVFFEPATENKSEPDGMTIDEKGNLYFTGRGGVWAVTPEGKALGLIRVPEFASNVCFGGPDGKTLYITCSKKVYSLQMTVGGGSYRR